MDAYIRTIAKSANYQYRRRVPHDVHRAFGRAWVEQSLGTSDRREARKRAAILTAKLEETWDTLRGKSTPLQQWRQGVDWLAAQKPLDLQDEGTFYAASDEFDRLNEGGTKLPENATREAYISYLRRERTVSRPSLSMRDALKVWIAERKPTLSAERGATRVVEQFMRIAEETPLDALTRSQARRYRDGLVAAGTAPGSISTYLAYLRTIFENAIKEQLIEERANPFAALKVERDKAPEEEREPIPRDACLAILDQSLADGYDQGDWFAAVLITTGMRPIEAYKAKLVKDVPVPYWDVPRAKTSPPRRIPVHPLLLDKEPRKYTVRPEQLRRQFIERQKPFVGYQARHSFKDEAERVGTPLEMRMRLMGHSRRKIAGMQGRYGSSQADLQEARKWIDLMWRSA